MPFTHITLYAQTLLHTHTRAFTDTPFFTQTILHKDAFTHRHFDTQKRLRRDTFTHTHTCSETAYRIIDVECIARAKTLQLNLTDTVKTVPFRGETERITKMM